MVDKEAGADCKRVLKAASTSRARSAALKQRFQGGAVDEVSFLGAAAAHFHLLILVLILILTRFPCRRQGASADKLHLKAAKFLFLVGLARSKQDPINSGHGAQYMYRPPLAGANLLPVILQMS